MAKFFILIGLGIGFALNSFGQSNLRIEYKENPNRTVDFYFYKDDLGSATVTIRFTQLSNAKFSQRPRVVRGRSGKMFTLRPVVEARGISFSYGYSYATGSINSKVDSSFVYTLPFKKGISVKARNAGISGVNYQFSAPEADMVFATRKGIVIKVINDFKNNLEGVVSSDMNMVLVEHADGSLASYKGFLKGEVLVAMGDKVYPQTPLGRIGSADQGSFNSLFFEIYFLSRNKLYHNASETALRRSVYQDINPIFYTSGGNTKLTEGTTYVVDFDESTLTKEFSKRERKNAKRK